MTLLYLFVLISGRLQWRDLATKHTMFCFDRKIASGFWARPTDHPDDYRWSQEPDYFINRFISRDTDVARYPTQDNDLDTDYEDTDDKMCKGVIDEAGPRKLTL